MHPDNKIVSLVVITTSYLRFSYAFRPRRESATFLFATMHIRHAFFLWTSYTHQACAYVLWTSYTHQACACILLTSYTHQSCMHLVIIHTSGMRMYLVNIVHTSGMRMHLVRTSYTHQACACILWTSYTHQACAYILWTSNTHQACIHLVNIEHTSGMHSYCEHRTHIMYACILWTSNTHQACIHLVQIIHTSGMRLHLVNVVRTSGMRMHLVQIIHTSGMRMHLVNIVHTHPCGKHHLWEIATLDWVRTSTKIWPYSPVDLPVCYIRKLAYPILCSPNEDFGRSNKHSGTCFRSTFQRNVAQIEYSRMWKVLWKLVPERLLVLPKSSFGEHKFDVAISRNYGYFQHGYYTSGMRILWTSYSET